MKNKQNDKNDIAKACQVAKRGNKAFRIVDTITNRNRNIFGRINATDTKKHSQQQ